MKQTFKTFFSLLKNEDFSEVVKIFKEECSWDVRTPLYHYAYKDTATVPVVAHSQVRDNDARKISRDVIQFAHKAEWNQLPDRSKSTFFSTSKDAHPLIKKGSYLYAAYPFKNQKIAVLNALDFNAVTIELGGLPARFRHVVGYLRVFAYIMEGKWQTLETNESISHAYKLLERTSSEEYRKALDANRHLISSSYNEFIPLVRYFDEFKQQVLSGWTPSDLGITLQNTSNFRFPEKTSEVWLEGKYVLVPIHHLRLFIKQVENANL